MPGPQVPPLAARRVAFGCVALFMLPFFGAGVMTLAKGVRDLQSGVETGGAYMQILAGLLFTAFSVGMFSAVAYTLRKAAQAAALVSRYPDQPWMWREDWSARRIPERSRFQVTMLWIVAIFWSAVSSPLLFVFRREWDRSGPAIALALIFPGVGLILLIVAVYATLRCLKFGVSVITIDQLPIPPAGRLTGAILTRGEPAPESFFLLKLVNVRRITTGSGKNRKVHEEVLFTTDQRVSGGTVLRAPDGIRIPFHFDMPPDARSTDISNASDQILWRLEAEADLPGVDYAAKFELPVFGTAISEATHEQIASYHAEHRAEAAQRPLSDDRVEVVPTAEGGVEFRVAPRRSIATAFAFLLFLAVWTLVIYTMTRFGAPRVFPVFFGFFEVLIIVMAADFLFGRAVVRASRGGIEWRRSIGGGGRLRLIPASDVKAIRAATNGQINNKPLWDVEVQLANGRKRSVVSYLRESDDAETIAARLWQALGRS